MKFLKTKLHKTLFWVIATIIIIVALVITFISPIAKYSVEKYDFNYAGRQITMDLPYINPFTGFVHLRNLKIREVNSDSVFFSCEGITVNLTMNKLLSKNYEITELTLTKPRAIIIQNKKLFNFSDLIKKFARDTLKPKKHKDPAHFNILNISIKDGTFIYAERSIPVYYFVKHVNVESEGIKWNVDTIPVKFALESGIGSGTIEGNFTLKQKSLDYRMAVLINKFDLSILEQYLKDIANYGSLRANLDADLKATGNLKNSQNINAKGMVAINELHFGKNSKEDFVAFKKFTISIKQLSPLGKKYMFDSISLLQPYVKYERYDHLDNVQNMFGKGGKKVGQAKQQNAETNILFLLADYVKLLAKNFFKSNYKVQRLALYNGDIHYNDYAINEKFAVAANPLTVVADSIERSSKWVNVSLKTGLKPYGNINVNLSVNPLDSSDFTFNYNLQKLPVAMFNPYLITFTSFPFERGTVELKGRWDVNNGYIQSRNHFIMIDPKVHDKQKRNGAKWIPLKLIMFFARERGNVIDYEVPIVGDLKDPKFKLKDVIFDALTNIFVKPATTPYRSEVKSVESEIEKSQRVKWELRYDEMQSGQERFVQKMADFLKDNPSASIYVVPDIYVEKEKEYISFFESKKLYYCALKEKNSKDLNRNDTLDIEKISIKDSLFVRYIDKKVGKNSFYTIQDKCKHLIGGDKINAKYSALEKARKNLFLSYFKEEGVQQLVHFKAPQNRIPYNGFSFYKIEYKGAVPEELQEAYNEINDLNNSHPRKEYKKLREKNRKANKGK